MGVWWDWIQMLPLPLVRRVTLGKKLSGDRSGANPQMWTCRRTSWEWWEPRPSALPSWQTLPYRRYSWQGTAWRSRQPRTLLNSCWPTRA